MPGMNHITPAARTARFPNAPALVLCLVAGCGGEPIVHINADGEAKLISNVVEEFNESSMDARKSSRYFTKGMMPKGAEFKKYGKYAYLTTDTAKTSGDTATMGVTLQDPRSGEDAGKVEWTFKKETNGWKIATAPLP